MGRELYLLDEPLGPYRLSVWQPEPYVFGPPQTSVDVSQLNIQFDVIFQFYPYADAKEFKPPCLRHRFLFDRTSFLSPFETMEITFGFHLKLSGVSDIGIQQIFHHVHSHAQAIANHHCNSNQHIIPLRLYLEFLGDANRYDFDNQFNQVFGIRDANQDDYDNRSDSVMEESMNDSSYNPVSATKSVIEALEKVRLEDAN